MGLLDNRCLDPLLLGSPLRRPRVALLIALALLLLIALAAITLHGLLSLRPNVARIFLTAVVWSSFLALVPLAIFWYLDRREREALWLFIVAFLLGAFVAIGIAAPVNGAILHVMPAWVNGHALIVEVLGPDASTLLGESIAGPLVEEVTKGLGLLVLFFFLRAEFDGIRDGLVYGGLIGLGVNWLEAPIYIANGYVIDGTVPWVRELASRFALFGVSSHAMYTGLFGAFLGLALQTHRRWLQVVAPMIGLVLAIVAHGLNNANFAMNDAAVWVLLNFTKFITEFTALPIMWVAASIAELPIFLPSLVIVAILLWRSGLWERRVIREELAGEIGQTVSAEEYQQILGDAMFRTRRIDRIHPARSRGLINAQHELAFRKRRVRDEGGDPDQDPLVRSWRDEIFLLKELA
jgi:protease PrsW